MKQVERYETVIVGGGQAGLSVGYHLKKQGRSFVILDASERVGDPWRKRWDSLRLYSPAGYDGLPGLRFPAKRTASRASLRRPPLQPGQGTYTLPSSWRPMPSHAGQAPSQWLKLKWRRVSGSVWTRP